MTATTGGQVALLDDEVARRDVDFVLYLDADVVVHAHGASLAALALLDDAAPLAFCEAGDLAMTWHMRIASLNH